MPILPSINRQVMQTEADKEAGESSVDQVMKEIEALRRSSRIVTTAAELEALEREIRELTNRLASLLLEQKVQASVDSEEGEQGEKNW